MSEECAGSSATHAIFRLKSLSRVGCYRVLTSRHAPAALPQWHTAPDSRGRAVPRVRVRGQTRPLVRFGSAQRHCDLAAHRYRDRCRCAARRGRLARHLCRRVSGQPHHGRFNRHVPRYCCRQHARGHARRVLGRALGRRPPGVHACPECVSIRGAGWTAQSRSQRHHRCHQPVPRRLCLLVPLWPGLADVVARRRRRRSARSAVDSRLARGNRQCLATGTMA